MINEKKEGKVMQEIIRFSLFGNYEKFNTNNFEIYMKLIQFFGQKGFKPATANELQLQSNGQARVLIMPNFINDSGTIIEITSNRINFQKTLSEGKKVSELKAIFECELSELLMSFISEVGITAGRVALNCEILNDSVELGMPTQSSFYDNKENTEMAIKNVMQMEMNQELCNVILEKYVNRKDVFTKYVYDINSQVENQLLRFNSDNFKSMYDAFIDIAVQIERGLK